MVDASDGTPIDLDDLDQTLSYTNGVLQYTQVTYRGNTYRSTLTYTNGLLTTIGRWVKQ